MINHYKMAKHFIVTVTDDDLTFERNVEQAEAEAEAEAELPKRKPKPKPKPKPKRIHATKTSADFHLVPLCGAIKKPPRGGRPSTPPQTYPKRRWSHRQAKPSARAARRSLKLLKTI